MADYGSGAAPEKRGKTKGKENTLAALYCREIERYNRAVKDWHEEGEQIEAVYLDETRTAASSRKFALLWANVETLKPAVYAKTPTVVCSRRFKDRDKIARTAAELMERATNTSIDLYNVDETIRMVRDDRLLPGRGQAWVRYEATIEKTEASETVVDENGNEVTQTVEYEKLASEKVCVDYVHWQDFGHNLARTWNDVWLVWRCVYKTHDEVAERFGIDVANSISYNAKMPTYGAGSATDDPDKRCKIYELWDKHRRLTTWMVDGEKRFIESGPPPIDFRNGFPCPEPCYATKTSKQLIPKPDYSYYRDQAKEINDLTEKIGRLTEWLVVKAFVPGGPSPVADAIEESIRDKTNRELFIPVESMSQWTERGGAAKLIDWLPIENVVKAIQASIQARAQLLQDVFELTGISDILRGQTDPNETLGAQQLKAQTGSRRLRNTKDEVARWCRDIAALMAEVIAEKFEPQSIADITGYRYVPTPPQPMLPAGAPMMGQIIPPGQPMPMIGSNGSQTMNESDPELVFDDRVIELLRNDKLRSFRVDIETDSTVQADEQAEKQSRSEFLNTVGAYLERAASFTQGSPGLAEIARELLMFTARGFHVGRGLEDTLERGFAQVAQQLQQQQANPPPDPKMIETQARIEANKAKLQSDVQLAAQKQQSETMLAAQKQQADIALSERELENQVELANRKQVLDTATKIRQQDQQAATARAKDRAERMFSRLQ